jgi:hypothetical protein
MSNPAVSHQELIKSCRENQAVREKVKKEWSSVNIEGVMTDSHFRKVHQFCVDEMASKVYIKKLANEGQSLELSMYELKNKSGKQTLTTDHVKNLVQQYLKTMLNGQRLDILKDKESELNQIFDYYLKNKSESDKIKDAMECFESGKNDRERFQFAIEVVQPRFTKPKNRVDKKTSQIDSVWLTGERLPSYLTYQMMTAVKQFDKSKLKYTHVVGSDHYILGSQVAMSLIFLQDADLNTIKTWISDILEKATEDIMKADKEVMDYYRAIDSKKMEIIKSKPIKDTLKKLIAYTQAATKSVSEKIYAVAHSVYERSQDTSSTSEFERSYLSAVAFHLKKAAFDLHKELPAHQYAHVSKSDAQAVIQKVGSASLVQADIQTVSDYFASLRTSTARQDIKAMLRGLIKDSYSKLESTNMKDVKDRCGISLLSMCMGTVTQANNEKLGASASADDEKARKSLLLLRGDQNSVKIIGDLEREINPWTSKDKRKESRSYLTQADKAIGACKSLPVKAMFSFMTEARPAVKSLGVDDSNRTVKIYPQTVSEQPAYYQELLRKLKQVHPLIEKWQVKYKKILADPLGNFKHMVTRYCIDFTNNQFIDDLLSYLINTDSNKSACISNSILNGLIIETMNSQVNRSIMIKVWHARQKVSQAAFLKTDMCKDFLQMYDASFVQWKLVTDFIEQIKDKLEGDNLLLKTLRQQIKVRFVPQIFAYLYITGNTEKCLQMLNQAKLEGLESGLSNINKLMLSRLVLHSADDLLACKVDDNMQARSSILRDRLISQSISEMLYLPVSRWLHTILPEYFKEAYTSLFDASLKVANDYFTVDYMKEFKCKRYKKKQDKMIDITHIKSWSFTILPRDFAAVIILIHQNKISLSEDCILNYMQGSRIIKRDNSYIESLFKAAYVVYASQADSKDNGLTNEDGTHQLLDAFLLAISKALGHVRFIRHAFRFVADVHNRGSHQIKQYCHYLVNTIVKQQVVDIKSSDEEAYKQIFANRYTDGICYLIEGVYMHSKDATGISQEQLRQILLLCKCSQYEQAVITPLISDDRKLSIMLKCSTDKDKSKYQLKIDAIKKDAKLKAMLISIMKSSAGNKYNINYFCHLQISGLTDLSQHKDKNLIRMLLSTGSQDFDDIIKKQWSTLDDEQKCCVFFSVVCSKLFDKLKTMVDVGIDGEFIEKVLNKVYSHDSGTLTDVDSHQEDTHVYEIMTGFWGYLANLMATTYFAKFGITYSLCTQVDWPDRKDKLSPLRNKIKYADADKLIKFDELTVDHLKAYTTIPYLICQDKCEDSDRIKQCNDTMTSVVKFCNMLASQVSKNTDKAQVLEKCRYLFVLFKYNIESPVDTSIYEDLNTKLQANIFFSQLVSDGLQSAQRNAGRFSSVEEALSNFKDEKWYKERLRLKNNEYYSMAICQHVLAESKTKRRVLNVNRATAVDEESVKNNISYYSAFRIYDYRHVHSIVETMSIIFNTELSAELPSDLISDKNEGIIDNMAHAYRSASSAISFISNVVDKAKVFKLIEKELKYEKDIAPGIYEAYLKSMNDLAEKQNPDDHSTNEITNPLTSTSDDRSAMYMEFGLIVAFCCSDKALAKSFWNSVKVLGFNNAIMFKAINAAINACTESSGIPPQKMNTELLSELNGYVKTVNADASKLLRSDMSKLTTPGMAIKLNGKKKKGSPVMTYSYDELLQLVDIRRQEFMAQPSAMANLDFMIDNSVGKIARLKFSDACVKQIFAGDIEGQPVSRVSKIISCLTKLHYSSTRLPLSTTFNYKIDNKEFATPFTGTIDKLTVRLQSEGSSTLENGEGCLLIKFVNRPLRRRARPEPKIYKIKPEDAEKEKKMIRDLEAKESENVEGIIEFNHNNEKLLYDPKIRAHTSFYDLKVFKDYLDENIKGTVLKIGDVKFTEHLPKDIEGIFGDSTNIEPESETFQFFNTSFGEGYNTDEKTNIVFMHKAKLLKKAEDLIRDLATSGSDKNVSVDMYSQASKAFGLPDHGSINSTNALQKWRDFAETAPQALSQ